MADTSWRYKNCEVHRKTDYRKFTPGDKVRVRRQPGMTAGILELCDRIATFTEFHGPNARITLDDDGSNQIVIGRFLEYVPGQRY